MTTYYAVVEVDEDQTVRSLLLFESHTEALAHVIKEARERGYFRLNNEAELLRAMDSRGYYYMDGGVMTSIVQCRG